MLREEMNITGQKLFFAGGGEMGERMRAINWAETKLGAVDGWPQSLRTALSIMLSSKFPMFIFWGKEHICFYNDAYRPSLGNNGKHPLALGKNGIDVWPEIWPVIKPLLDQVLSGGEATWAEDQLIPIYRNGQMEDVYWTYSYSAIKDESGQPAGVFVTCSETTGKVNNERDLKENSDQLRFTIDSADLGTWDYNPVNNAFKGNPRLKDWFGLEHITNEQIDLGFALEAVHINDREKLVQHIRQAMVFETGGKLDVEYTIRHPKTGRQRIVKAIGSTVFDADKKASRLYGILQDITQQVQSTSLLRESEAKFRVLVSEIPVGITVFRGKEFVVEMANPFYLRLVDRKEKDFVGKPLFDVLPEVKPAVEPLLTQVYNSGNAYYGYEFPVTLNRYGKAEVSYFNFVYHPAYDNNGEVNGIIVVANEVTEMVRSKHFLSESEKSFRNMVMQSPIPMTIFKGPDHVIEMANTIMFENIWRKKEADVIGKKALDVFPELRGQKYPQLLKKVFESGVAHSEKESQAIVEGDDGTKIFYLDFEYAPLADPDGLVSGILITVNDVTEKVEARKKIEEAEARARLATEVGGLGVFELDILTNKVLADDTYHRIFGTTHGMSREELMKVYHPDDIPLRNKAHESMMLAGHTHYEARLVVNGIVKWVRISARVVHNEAGEPAKISGVVQEITEQKQNLEALEQKVKERTADLHKMNAELERSNTDLEQFAHVISHDMKEPVRKIKTYSNRLTSEFENQLGEQGSKFIEKIDRATTRLYSMIDGVLLYSSVTNTDARPEKTDLTTIVKNIQDDLEIMIREKNAAITTAIHAPVMGIPPLLNQLFYNLINNSLKFSKAGGGNQIHVSHDTEELDGKTYSKTVITDTGIGFDNEYAEKIFTTFTRLHPKDHYEGTGLGLALCKKIIERHNGKIYAHGKKEEGSTFTIYLPFNQ